MRGVVSARYACPVHLPKSPTLGLNTREAVNPEEFLEIVDSSSAMDVSGTRKYVLDAGGWVFELSDLRLNSSWRKTR